MAAKITCDLCGLRRYPSAIRRHRSSRPCRAQQVRNRMRENHELRPLRSLDLAKALTKAGIPYLRIPADPKFTYRNPSACGYRDHPKPVPEPDTSGPLYESLGDCLFVPAWVAQALETFLRGAAFRDKCWALKDMTGLPEEGRLAVLAAHCLAGRAAAWATLEDMLRS